MAQEGRFGFDIGGTFTDIVVSTEKGELFTTKILSRPSDIGGAVVDGLLRLLRRHGISPQSFGKVVFGATTVVTNLVIERKGLKTGLITTKGFRDVIEIGREIRYDIYDLDAGFPDPLVPRELRWEIDERIDNSGAVLKPAVREEIERTLREAREKGVASLAVSLLHSFRNPVHERLVREIATEVTPEIFISLSSEVLPEIREYERTIATVLNAYVLPSIGQYLKDLEQSLRRTGMDADLHIMQSNGGVISRSFAEKVPLRLLESGPAAGALAAMHVAESAGVRNVLSFDMGGTTAKACLIWEGRPQVTTEFEAARVHRFKKGSGLPVRLPIIDLIEIGAGGGSIARIDETGLLKVGPDSAGAEPGPACYGRGGTDPTVTDAALLLGYLNPERPLGGDIELRPDLAGAAISKMIAEPLGVSTVEAASGIHRIVCEQMATAAKIHAVEKGKDVRRCAVVAFGGAGPVHAREVARRMGCRRVIVPPNAGVLSAFGLLVAPAKADAVRTHFVQLRKADWSAIEALFREMEKETLEILRTAGVSANAVSFHRYADMRYVGQGFELSLRLPRSFDSDPAATVTAAFQEIYRETFGHSLENVEVEALNWRVEAVAAATAPIYGSQASANGEMSEAIRERLVYFPDIREFLPTPVITQRSIKPGQERQGPALVEQEGTTAVIGFNDRFLVDDKGNLVIDIDVATGTTQ